MISQQDIDRGVVVTVEGRKFLHITRHVRWRPFFVKYSNAPDECMWEYWAPNSQRWVIAGEEPKVGDTVCLRQHWPHPLFSQRARVYASANSMADAHFITGNQIVPLKTLCIV